MPTKLSIVGVSGNGSRPSRTATLVGAVLHELERRLDTPSRLIELIDATPEPPSHLSAHTLEPRGRELIEAIEQADLLVVGTPVILTATGSGSLHRLVIEHQLRPLFGFFGAWSAPTGIFATEADLHDYRIPPMRPKPCCTPAAP